MNILRNSTVAVLAAVALSTVPMAAAHAATPTAGQFCSKKDAGKTGSNHGHKLKCTKNGKVYQWKA